MWNNLQHSPAPAVTTTIKTTLRLYRTYGARFLYMYMPTCFVTHRKLFQMTTRAATYIHTYNYANSNNEQSSH